MKVNTHRSIRAFFVLAAFWLAASAAVAGKWEYSSSNNYITHSDTAWVLNVTRNDKALTVTGVYSSQASTALPLADVVSGGYQITSIGEWAFYGCTGLTGVTIPDSVKSIGESAFKYCKSLKEVTIGAGVKSIGAEAFMYCNGLTSVTIGAGVTSIGYRAFFGCKGIRNMTFNANLPSFRASSVFSDSRQSWTDLVIGGSVTSIGESAFSGCNGLTSVTISDSVTSIGASAFSGCTGLTGVTIPSSVTSIGASAFSGCTGLTGVTIPDSVTSIGASAFSGCTGLTGVTIPDSVTSIGASAFSGCTGLTGVTIPDSVTSIGGGAFWGCTGLKNIAVEASNAVYHDINGVVFSKDLAELHIYPAGRIGEYMIPDSVTSIGDCAFYGCTGLTGVTIPDSVTSIGESAFGECTGLISVTIGAGVTSIGEYAFYGCTGLTGVTIPDSVTSIGDGAFRSCTGLTGVTIGAGVTSIGEWAFYWCLELKSVIVGAGVNEIGDGAFSHCMSLIDVTFRGSYPNVVPGYYDSGGIYGDYCGCDEFTPLEMTTYILPKHLDSWNQHVADSCMCEEFLIENGNAIWQGRPILVKADTTPSTPAVGTYNAFLYSVVRFGNKDIKAPQGVIDIKLSKAVGAMSAKVMLQGGNVSFTAQSWDASDGDKFQATMSARSGETMELQAAGDQIWGTITGGKAGDGLEFDGVRNRFVVRGDNEATALLNKFEGAYTMALPVADSISASPAVDAAPGGVGYLTLSVGKQGKIKLAGVLADGTKVSRAATLLALDESGNEACVTLFAPLYSKKGAISGLLWINAANRTITTDIGDDWYLLWNNPGKRGEDGFSQLLNVCGGFYDKAMTLDPTYRFGADVTGTAWFIPAGDVFQWVAQPDGVAVTGSGVRLAIAKSQKPKKITDKETRETWYDYDDDNPCNVTISFAARSGIFKGKYALYCDYEDANGKLIHKAVSVPYFGIVTQTRDVAFANAPIGMGYSLVPESDPALKAFKLKHSCPVWLE